MAGAKALSQGHYRVTNHGPAGFEVVAVDGGPTVILTIDELAAIDLDPDDVVVGVEFALITDGEDRLAWVRAEPLKLDVPASRASGNAAFKGVQQGQEAELVVAPELTQSERDTLGNKKYCAVLDEDGKILWRIDGDKSLEDWRSQRAAQAVADDEAAAEREREAARKEREERLDFLFINPYTFIPLPGELVKSAPAGHALLRKSQLSGVLDVEWTVETPLACSVDRRDMAEHERDGNTGANAKVGTLARGRAGVVIPGSSLKGAVRSLHEALANGCMRVLNAAFVPVYREHASPEHRRGYVLGYVEEVSDGRPTKVRLTSDFSWVKASDLLASRTKLGGTLASGQRYRIASDPKKVFDRLEHEKPAVTALEGQPEVGDHTILLAATNSARDNRTFWCVTGQLSDEVLAIGDDGWREFLSAVEGAEDPGLTGRAEISVTHRPEGVVGTALGPSAVLGVGQVIWIKPKRGREGREIERISLSALWRSKGGTSVGERAETHKPCQRSDELCPSCQIFGSAETETKDGDAAGGEQRSYRGHVRFGDGLLTSAGGQPLEFSDLEHAVKLAPLLSPRPGSGQFYLQNNKRQLRANRGEVPLRQWGSAADGPSPRPISGRKFYWHGDPSEQKQQRRLATPRHELRGQSADTSSRVDLVPVGTTIKSTLHFEGLTPEQLGSLLLAIDPSQEMAESVRTRIGGAKPLGLGTVRPGVTRLRVQDAGGRYAGGGSKSAAAGPEEVEQAVTRLVSAFVDSVPESTRSAWPDLEAALRPDHVDPRSIWYPPGADWSSANTEDFDHSYAFFGKSDGAFVADKHRSPEHKGELVTLRRPRDYPQDLPIDPSQEDEIWWRKEQ